MKSFTMLENNPAMMTPLAHALGLSKDLEFHDVYSLSEPSLLAMIPRPCHALLVIIPLTPAWQQLRQQEAADMDIYNGVGPDEPVLWFKQTIHNACGLIGLISCCLNGEAAQHVIPGSLLAQIRNEAVSKTPELRAKVLEDSAELQDINQSFAQGGDTKAPADGEGHKGQHFVAFVKGKDGHLWELEGDRKGPLDRGLLEAGEDVLSPTAVRRGLGKYIELAQKNGGDLRFSCLALTNRVS